MSNLTEGLCVGHNDPDLWFSDTIEAEGSGRRPGYVEQEMTTRALQALAICSNCPAKQACLAVGMTEEHFDNGIWGGTLSGERIAMKRSNIKDNDRLRKINFARRVREAQLT
jgi:hypothetical protein